MLGRIKMPVLNIILIEDKEKDANAIKETYQKAVCVIKEKQKLENYLGFSDVTITWLKGGAKEEKVKRTGETYCFYDENICTRIQELIDKNQQAEFCTGILLDVSLSKAEFEKSAVNDYSDFKIARMIYENFDEQAPIYVVTNIREFGSQVLNLMGTKELIRRYISKALIIDYPSYGAIARTIKYMNDKSELNEEEEDEIDSWS